MTREEKIHRIGLVVLVGFVAAVAFHYAMAAYGGLGYPYNTFLFRPDDCFNDFRSLYNLMLHPDDTSNPLHRLGRGWFQFARILFLPCMAMGLSADAAVGLYLALVSVAFVWVCRRNLSVPDRFETWKNVIIYSFMTYPFLFTLDRANSEAVVFLLLMLFISAVQRERHTLAMVAIAAAIAMKPFPGVFLVLLLEKRLFRYALGAGVLSLAFNVLIGLLLYGNITLKQASNMGNYQHLYAIGNEGVFFGHSLWGCLKVLFRASFKLIGPVDMPTMASIYFWTMAAVFLMLTIYILRREQTLWKKVALLVCAMNLLPFVSGDYKLLHLFVPLFLFINAPDRDALDWVYCLLFALLLVPKAYVHVPRFADANIGILLNPLLMVALALVIVHSGLRRGAREGNPQMRVTRADLSSSSLG